jgi:hypothetical protein
MLLLVEIDLTAADLELFEEYEACVLALLAGYGASVEARLRSVDQSSEIHLLQFPSEEMLDAFRCDPARVAARDLWARCGAKASTRKVERIG